VKQPSRVICGVIVDGGEWVSSFLTAHQHN